jgi:Ca2+/Na+ antiporter
MIFGVFFHFPFFLLFIIYLFIKLQLSKSQRETLTTERSSNLGESPTNWFELELIYYFFPSFFIV